MPALSQTRAYAALLLIATLWGTFPATGKLAVQDFPPVFLTALRAVIASTFLVVLLLRSGAETIRGLGPGSIRAFVVLGVCGLVLSTQPSYVGYAYTTQEVLIQSDGSPWRPLVHVQDICQAFLAVLHAPRALIHNQAFNVGRTEENYRIREVAEMVRQVVPENA